MIGLKPMDVEIRPSKIHKRGVYALRAFAVGEVVLRWDVSRRVLRAQVTDLPAVDQAYLHPYDAESMFVVQPPERYVNHSCAHNTEVRDFCDVAVCAISAGEEITSNYETDGAGLSFTCGCGTPNCRGAIGPA